MAEPTDVLMFGTGQFAARILLDIAATAKSPVHVALAGRRPERLAWLRTAGHARAAMFASPVRIATTTADIATAERTGEVIARTRPKVIVQVASAQSASVITMQGNAWARLVAEGGLSATTVFQALLSSRVAKGLALSGHSAHLVNCCYADVANALIAAEKLPVTCGIGNVAILANAFAGELGPGARPVRVLAHYQTIGIFRRLPTDRHGPAPRVWLGDEEVRDVRATFRAVQLTPEPVIDISGASGVPMMLAMAAGEDWQGHAPGPIGLTGGYPVRLVGGRLDLDLPAGLGREEAIGWNTALEEASGLLVDAEGRARYTGLLHDLIRAHSPELAEGFAAADLETVYTEMVGFRSRLQQMPA
jgi:hypothetical protein